MSKLKLIVCEQSSRWAPALRTTVSNSFAALEPHVSMREVRSLGELDGWLCDVADHLVLVEVTPANFAAVLDWLAEKKFGSRRCQAVALLDRSLWAVAPTALESGRPFRGGEWQNMSDALREAGALEVASSPRRLHQVIRLGLLHSALSAPTNVRTHKSKPGAFCTSEQAIEQWALSLLPWQAAPGQLG